MGGGRRKEEEEERKKKKKERKEMNILHFLRWVCCPIVFSYCCFVLIFNSEKRLFFLDTFPPLSALDSPSSIAEKLPPTPENHMQTWNVSKLEAKLRYLENSHQSPEREEQIEEVLKEISFFLKRTIEMEERETIHQLKERIKEKEEGFGIATRVWGFFSVVNLLWLGAIIGITISTPGAIWVIMSPIQERLISIGSWFYYHFFVPVFSYLNRMGVFEFGAYVVAFFFVVQGLYHPTERGLYLSFTGLCLSLPCFLYSTNLHTFGRGDYMNFMTIWQLWNSVTWVPFAIYYQSQLIGFCCVMFFYGAIGFSVVCGGLCYFVGFRNKEIMARVAIASLFLLTFTIYLRIEHKDWYVANLTPFTTAISIFGTLTLLLALLIVSSVFYKSNVYIARQVYMILCLSCLLFVGSEYQMDGITNTTLVFVALYGLEKYSDLHFRADFNPFVLILFVSIFLFCFSFYLYEHPQYLVALYTSCIA